jgi:hypothetical protein
MSKKSLTTRRKDELVIIDLEAEQRNHTHDSSAIIILDHQTEACAKHLSPSQLQAVQSLTRMLDFQPGLDFKPFQLTETTSTLLVTKQPEPTEDCMRSNQLRWKPLASSVNNVQ